MKKYVNIIDLREVDSLDLYFVLGSKPMTEDMSVLTAAYRDGFGDIVSLSKEDIEDMNPHSIEEEFELARLYFSSYCQEAGLILVEDNFSVEVCPSCESEFVIRVPGISVCPFCGCSVVPCSLCDECDYSNCPYECTGGPEDLKLQKNRDVVQKDDAKIIYALLTNKIGE